MQTGKLYIPDDVLPMRQRAIAISTTARAAAVVAITDTESGLKDIVSGKDTRLHDAIVGAKAEYVFDMHRRAWEAYPEAEIKDVDCFGEIRHEDKSPYKAYTVVQMYAGCDLHGETIIPPEPLIACGHELLAEKMYLKELLELIEQIAQEDTVSYYIVYQQLADVEQRLAELHIAAIEYARQQGYVRETIRPRWKGGRIVVCRKC